MFALAAETSSIRRNVEIITASKYSHGETSGVVALLRDCSRSARLARVMKLNGGQASA